MRLVHIKSHDKILQLPVNAWGIPEPLAYGEYEETRQLDLLIMPGVCFTRHGARLGHGMGYYDRFIASLDSQPVKMALCLRE